MLDRQVAVVHPQKPAGKVQIAADLRGVKVGRHEIERSKIDAGLRVDAGGLAASRHRSILVHGLDQILEPVGHSRIGADDRDAGQAKGQVAAAVLVSKLAGEHRRCRCAGRAVDQEIGWLVQTLIGAKYIYDAVHYERFGCQANAPDQAVAAAGRRGRQGYDVQVDEVGRNGAIVGICGRDLQIDRTGTVECRRCNVEDRAGGDNLNRRHQGGQAGIHRQRIPLRGIQPVEADIYDRVGRGRHVGCDANHRRLIGGEADRRR